MNFGNKGTKRVFFVTCLLIIIISAGFARDFVFKSINAMLKAWDYDQDYSMPSFLAFLENFEYERVVTVKWMLTFAFAGLYFLITWFTIRFFFEKKYGRVSLYIYAGLGLASALFILSGNLFPSIAEKMYEFARFLMGLAQSPLILMILFPALLLAEKEKAKTKTG